MYTDFEDPNALSEFSCDVCIVGAGAAGISMALRLANTPVSVCLLESGGFEPEPATQSLYEGLSLGHERASPLGCRLRYFGGTTNHWQGWCAPLQELDFTVRAWIPDSGWPLKRSDLDPFYDAAQSILELGSDDYERPEGIGDEASWRALQEESVNVHTWQYSPPTRFGKAYREALDSANNIHVVLHANVIELETNHHANAVESVHFQSLGGHAGHLTARCYVLACGAMENARLLLQSDGVQSSGLGNQSGTLGRYFLQHPERKVASVLTDSADRLVHLFDRTRANNGSSRAHLTCSKQIQRRYSLLNAGFDIIPQRHFGSGYDALRGVVHDIRQGEWPNDLDTRVWTMLSDMRQLGGDLYDRASGEIAGFDLVAHAEQAPNPESRVALTAERDRLGMRKLQVDWRLTSDDKRSILESTLRIGEALASANLGRIKIEEWLLDGDSWPQPIWSGCHHMGTTRMSDSPDTGVVNRDSRLHSVRNLYLAGSSIFPTGGYVTPTLTIVALALRLADHLQGEVTS